MSEPKEETGLVLWGGIELDLTVQQLQKKRCACGQPASVSRLDLATSERRVLCAACAGRLR
jgi:hypothetical protein